MMGHREALKTGDEWDTFCARKHFKYRSGEAHSTKKRFSRRVRRDQKRDLRLQARRK